MKLLQILLAVLLILSVVNADACTKYRNAFYCALASPPCFWKAPGHCVQIKSKPHAEVFEFENLSVCTDLSQDACQVSKDVGCKWENNECIKEEVTKSFCESIKGKLTCVLSNCQWSHNHCHY